MRHLAIIPARSGSKGIKDKNIKLFCGKPLLQYTVEAAIKSGVFDEIMVSTDSPIYAEIAQNCGASVPFLRSRENSGDRAGSWGAVREVIGNYAVRGNPFDCVTLLQPTSPLRTEEDIQRAFHIFEERDADGVVAVCEAEHSPFLCNVLPDSGCMKGFMSRDQFELPRQNMSLFYRINGAIYIRRAECILRNEELYNERCYAYVMEQEKSVDIDSELDFEVAALLFERGKQKEQSVLS